MTVPAIRRIVVGVDGSAESVAALRWACREAGLRGAEIHAVHAWEAPCHSVASYAVPAQAPPPRAEAPGPESLWGLVPDDATGIRVRAEVAEGLAARVLLDRCAGADMLVLGSSSDTPGSPRAAGPVIRACLRRAPCPVVVISEASGPGVPAQGGPGMPAHAGARSSGAGSRSPAGACV